MFEGLFETSDREIIRQREQLEHDADLFDSIFFPGMSGRYGTAMTVSMVGLRTGRTRLRDRFAPPLFQPDVEILRDKATDNLHVGRVIYGKAATRARHRLVIEKAAEITSGCCKAHIKMPRWTGQSVCWPLG